LILNRPAATAGEMSVATLRRALTDVHPSPASLPGQSAGLGGERLAEAKAFDGRGAGTAEKTNP